MTVQEIVDKTVKQVAAPVVELVSSSAFKSASPEHKQQTLRVLEHAYATAELMILRELEKARSV